MEKKREILTTYTRQRQTILDSLPVDVIKYHIFPLLDYQTRLNMNLCLPPWDRVRTRMPPESVIKHQKDYCVKMLTDALIRLDEIDSEGKLIYTGEKRIKKMARLLNLFHRDEYFYIYTHYPRFRTVFMDKIDQMQEAANIRDGLYSSECLDELISVCNSLRNKILTYDGELTDSTSLHKILPLSFV
jgi:hypothetical protein